MDARPHRSPRKAKGQGPERREEILAAALRLFTEFGVYSVSTRQIAQAVGISQPTLYAYFPTKDDIGVELHSRAFELLARHIAASARKPVDTPEGFARMLRVYVDFGLQNPDMYRIAFMAENPTAHAWADRQEALSPASQSTYGVLQGEIASLHARGLTVDIEPETLTQSVWSAAHGLVALLIAKPGFPWVEREGLIETHLMLIARGVMKS